VRLGTRLVAGLLLVAGHFGALTTLVRALAWMQFAGWWNTRGGHLREVCGCGEEYTGAQRRKDFSLLDGALG
jgi:hypothetical protein